MNFELLYQLLVTPTVSGCEEAGQALALKYGKLFAHRQFTDAAGNAVSTLNPEGENGILLVGHMDEIGFRVTQIRDDGMLRLQSAGGVRPGMYLGGPMQVIHEEYTSDGLKTTVVRGVVAVTDELLKKESVSDSDLTLDIGAADKKEAEEAVAVGDPVCADTVPREMMSSRLSSRALDDKAGAFVVLEAARLAAGMNVSGRVDVCTATGEETTGRGAFFAASAVRPRLAVIVDVTWASDCPGGDAGRTGDVRLGGGPVLCRSGVVSRELNLRMEEAAKALDIPLQYEVAGGRTYTDGDTVLKSCGGIPVVLVSVPLRYMHSPVEMCDVRDVENCARLIAEFIRREDGRR
ncbi:MAG: M20/M25/M40 family metallo-hydrolase [Clostridia bacterium]|nr:M20/M25/M40 family metallo-hydrolase [Clostridia bacterium]